MKKIIVAIFAVFAFLLLGINGCNQEVAEKSDGLIISFVDMAPPSTIMTSQTFSVYVDAENKGDANIDEGGAKFYLKGVGENIKDIQTKISNSIFLEKGRGTERLVFAAKAKSPLELKDSYIFPLVLVSCYNYGTFTQIPVCVAKNESAVCDIKGEKVTSTSNSIAPIKITSLTENIVGNKIIVEFVVENKGAGESAGNVYLKNADCDILQDETHDEYINELLKEGKVDIDIKTEEGFTCSPHEELSLKAGGKGKVICEKILGKDDHTSLFTIAMNYKYIDSISKVITLMSQ